MHVQFSCEYLARFDDRGSSTADVDHSVHGSNDVSVPEIHSVGKISADTSDAKPAFPAPKLGSSYTRQSLPLLNLGRELYAVSNCAISPASSFHSSPESESSSDQHQFQSYHSRAPCTHYPSPTDDTNFFGSPTDAVLALQDASPYDFNDAAPATFPPDETPFQPYFPSFCSDYEPAMHRDTQAMNDVSLYPVNEPKYSDIMIDDKRALLKLMGFVDYHQNPAYISQLFTEKLIASTFGSSNGVLGSKGLCGRPMKAKISSDAGKAASADRRKVPPSFFCELREVCGASFTRKNGLISKFELPVAPLGAHGCIFVRPLQGAPWYH